MWQGFGSCGQGNKEGLQGGSCENTPVVAFMLERASSYSTKNPIYFGNFVFYFQWLEFAFDLGSKFLNELTILFII